MTTSALLTVQQPEVVTNPAEFSLTTNKTAIVIPEELKHWLTKEAYAINTQHKLHQLPSHVTVLEVIDDFITHKQCETGTEDTRLRNCTLGIIEYFDVLLSRALLYRSERQQHKQVLNMDPEVKIACIYGPFHLLRLFIRLGALLSFSKLDATSKSQFLDIFDDFLKYLVDNQSRYFTLEYLQSVDDLVAEDPVEDFILDKPNGVGAEGDTASLHADDIAD